MDCDELSISGSADISGDIKSRKLQLNGSCDVGGNIFSDEIKSNGSSDIDGDVTGKKIFVFGSTDVKGGLHGEEIEIAGSVDIGSDCEADRFKAAGSFDIGGLLNADEISITVSGHCRVQEIGGEKITITKDPKMTSNFLSLKRPGYLETKIIEGDDIYIEATVAETVRGNNVVIGPDCKIGNVEYKSEIKVSNNSRVESQKRI
jgi:cytoskeletal protein CcmA (bactofilin family)